MMESLNCYLENEVFFVVVVLGFIIFNVMFWYILSFDEVLYGAIICVFTYFYEKWIANRFSSTEK